MEMFQLRYFLAAARYENLSRAAKTMFVSQSAISRAIASLEAEFSTTFFERNGTHLKLNTQGLLLKERAAQALNILDETANELSSFEDARKHIIRIKMMNAFNEMPAKIEEFISANPEVGFHFISPESEEPYDIVVQSAWTKDLPEGAVFIQEDQLCMAVPVSSQFACRDGVYLKELRSCSFILPEKGDKIRDHFDRMCQEADLTPHIAHICYNYDYLKSLLRSGIGFCPWPRSSCQDIVSLQCMTIDIRDKQAPVYIYAMPGKSHYISDTAMAFLETIRGCAQGYNSVS